MDTGLWADVRELPGALGDTLAAADGVAEAADLLRGAERIVATGNGAAYYVAHALWLASLEGERAGPPIVAVPCGLAVRERFLWQPGDAVLAVSSSGEFRDVVEIARARGRAPVRRDHRVRGLLARGRRDRHDRAARLVAARGDAHAGAGGRVRVRRWRCGRRSPATPRSARCSAARPKPPRARSPRPRRGPPPSSPRSGRCRPPRSSPAAAPAWAAALELALMLKEIARIPAEGVETREGATSAMFGLDRGHLMVSLDPEGDPLGDEALRLCAATGATTLRLPGVAGADARLAPITTLPAAAALAATLALVGRPRRRPSELDGRLLPDRAERDVSIRRPQTTWSAT